MAESEKPSARQNSDLKAVQSLLDELDVEAKPVTVYRMGPREDDDGNKRTRLLKVVMPASVHARLALKNSKNLKNVDGYKKVFVRPSLTREERVEQAELRKIVRALVAEGHKKVHIKRNTVCINNKEYYPENPPPIPTTSF